LREKVVDMAKGRA